MTRVQRLTSPTPIITAVKTCTNHYQTVNGNWEEIESVRLRSQLNNPWSNIRRVLRRKLSDFPRYEYVRTTGYTNASAIPHFYVIVYAEDPDDNLHPDIAELLIDCYVRGNEYPRSHVVVST